MKTPDEVEKKFGPQCETDGPFRRMMRLHQSKWREAQGLPCGSNKQGRAYGNLLTEADGKAGKNFYSDKIMRLVMDRICLGVGVEPDRCLRNLLSSQPMAFNLFGPLCLDPNLAAVLLADLPGGVNAPKVTIEFAPQPKADYLDDATSFDVAVHYTTHAGDSAFAGIEVKLSEPFSPTRYGHNDRHATLYKATSTDPAIWAESPSCDLTSPQVNQIWRTHMLAQAYQRAGKVMLATAVILVHSGEKSCDAGVSAYRSALTAEGNKSLLHWTIGDLTAHWRALLSARPDLESGWLDWFMIRYPDPLC